MSTVSGPTIFQVSYPGDPLQTDPLELWQSVAHQKNNLIDGDQPGVVWRADLPEDPVASARQLTIHAVTLHQTNLALQATGSLLQQDLQWAATNRIAEGQVDFGVSPIQDLSRSTSERYNLVAQALNGDPQEVSFGLQDELTEALEIVSRFASSVHRLVEQFALVESGRGGLSNARTRVEWLGDVQTWWVGRSPSIVMADHRCVLNQALATRQAWLRLATTLTAGAAKVGMAMATGPFNPLAIMTVWKYVKKVIEQYRIISRDTSSRKINENPVH